MSNPEVEYLSCPNTAKLLRVALKSAFPSVKFSVKSKTYSGGASIDIDWIDGPLESQVKGVSDVYAGGGFDGMIDMKYSVYAWLSPDGTVTFAKTTGTAGSAGVVPSDQVLQPSLKSKLVRFGADFVFCTRRYSAAFLQRGIDKVCARYGVKDKIQLRTWSDGSAHVAQDMMVPGADQYLATLVHREMVRRTNYLLACTSTKETV